MKRNLTLMFVVFILLAGFLVFKFTNVGNFFPTTAVIPLSTSPDILYLTNPVHSFSGVIDKVDNNTLTVSKKVDDTTLIYKVSVSDKTKFFRNNLLVSPSATSSAALTFHDLKPGQTVLINTTKDLRLLSSREFEASDITLTINTLSGTITNIKGNLLTVKGFIPTLDSPDMKDEQKEYNIEITPNTQIRNPLNPSSTVSDLKKDSQIIVYFESPSDSKNIKASMIQIIPAVSAGSAIQISTPSAQ